MNPKIADVNFLKKHYKTDFNHGLSEFQILENREKFGDNRFRREKKISLLKKIIHHLLETMNIILLLVASLAAYLSFIGDNNYTKTFVILFIVIINLIVSIVQESRAENALDALKKLSAPTSTVIREGKTDIVPSYHLVCGDIIKLTAGKSVGADIRLISSNSLQIDESSLTGESEPVDKDYSISFDKEVPLGDQINMVFSGTNVLRGTALGCVVAVGSESQLGKIATLIDEQVKEKTPLQKRIDTLAKRLALIAFASGILIFLINFFMNEVPLIDNLMTAVVLGVAAVPETLPVIVTLSLIYGVQNMAHKKAIIRNIPAVETLGNATIIASDKTGTLTQNQMAIQKIWVNGDKVWSKGNLTEQHIDLLQKFASASNATAQQNKKDWKILGDPTEVAILRFLLENKIFKEELKINRVLELPFDSERKKMTVVLHQGDKYLVLTKGAFDRLVSSDNSEAHKIHDQFADEALRVLALSYKIIDEIPDDLSILEDNQTFLGIIGMIDPPRPESYSAVQEARAAGIKPIMITGDHAITAKAIAKDLDIYREGDIVMEGISLSELTDRELLYQIEKISVYARVSPKDKLRIVKSWQNKGQIVAMTGDGVNDAPSLRAADVGTAMGISGTEVSKSASDIILADDNFSTIVSAIREGRRVYANIKKTIYYLLSANIAEILTMLIGAIIGWGLPFNGIQLLYINVLADGIPGFGISREEADDHIMQQDPIGVTESLFSRGVSRSIAICSAAFIVVSLIGFGIGRFLTIDGLTPSHQLGQTMAFIVLTLSSTINVYNARSNESIFKVGIIKNKMILITTIISLSITVLFTHIPFLMNILDITSLSMIHWFIVIILSLFTVFIIEISKLVLRIQGKKFLG